MTDERPTGQDDAPAAELVLLLDAELEAGSALIVDDAVTLRPRGAAKPAARKRSARKTKEADGSGDAPAGAAAPAAPAGPLGATGAAAPAGPLGATGAAAPAAPAVPGRAPRSRRRGARPPDPDPVPGTDTTAPAPQVPPDRRRGPPVQLAGVDHGNVATEVLEPFVRAIEVLLRGLAESLGEDAGHPATVRFGDTVIEYSSPGWGDDVVRVYRAAAERRRDPADGVASAAADAAALAAGAPRGPRDRWELGASAAREGNHAVALQLFEEEAREAEAAGVSQRAAIAYRSASREAGLIGRRDYANMLLRLAGKHYLLVAEEVRTSTRGKVQAYVTAAKCFLQAGNLPLAESCIGRARSAADALGEG